MRRASVIGSIPDAPVKRFFFTAGAFGGSAILPTMSVYYGTSALATLTGSQIKALQGTRLDTTTTGPYLIPATLTPEYVYIAVPLIFGPPGNRSENRGFQFNEFLTDMAGPAEGYANQDSVSGWYYITVAVDGVNYKLFRSRFELSGDGFMLFCT